MARASELIDFRRAFWWLLGGVLIPSVALVAFGVVAVANERAAVERRLADEYGARLRALDLSLHDKVEAAARTIAVPGAQRDPLLRPTFVLDARALLPAGLEELARRAQELAMGGHFLAGVDQAGDRHVYAFARVADSSSTQIVAAEVDLAALAERLQPLSAGPGM